MGRWESVYVDLGLEGITKRERCVKRSNEDDARKEMRDRWRDEGR